MDGKNGERMAIEPASAGQATRFCAHGLARAHLPFLREDCATGVAALEHRESVADVSHVVASLQRGYIPPDMAAERMSLLGSA